LETFAVSTSCPFTFLNLKLNKSFFKERILLSKYIKKNSIYAVGIATVDEINKINIKKSLWKGECFVFDNRVSVKHKLSPGSYAMCRGCRMPISVQEKKSSKYKEGISCPNCYNKLTKSQKDRFSMRQKQILISRKLNKAHIYQKEY